MKKILILVIVLILTLAIVIPSAALPKNPTSMNARFVNFLEESHVIHILVFWDEGRPGYGPAIVSEGQPVLFGFEWGGNPVEVLQELYIDNPDHDITLSVDGEEPFSVKDWYQPPFISETQSGPAWSWDHDGDGPGDGNGNGIGDWNTTVLFFRYQSPGLSAGTHTFDFSYTDDNWGTYYGETITVEAVP